MLYYRRLSARASSKFGPRPALSDTPNSNVDRLDSNYSNSNRVPRDSNDFSLEDAGAARPEVGRRPTTARRRRPASPDGA